MRRKTGRVLASAVFALLLAGCDKCTDLLSPFRTQSAPQSCSPETPRQP